MTKTALITCRTGCEKILSRELALYKITALSKGRGWILAQWGKTSLSKERDTPLTDPCFAYHILSNPVSVKASSVNTLTEKLFTCFTTHIGQTRIVKPWAFLFLSSDNEQLNQHAKTVERCWSEKMRKKISRVAKLSKEGIFHHSRFTEGFFVHFTNFNQVFVSFNALCAGQQRMQMDPLAPSRSYLKIEEAFKIFGHEPRANDTVIDLGAAPGGWSYSALQRGASVTAIDNGPLKGPVRSHMNICHLKNDALTYSYNQSEPADWLLCDILEEPNIILNLLQKWLDQKWCRYFIVNIKIGRNDPVRLLQKIRDPKQGILPYCKTLSIRQLYHDREELTLMGEAK